MIHNPRTCHADAVKDLVLAQARTEGEDRF